MIGSSGKNSIGGSSSGYFIGSSGFSSVFAKMTCFCFLLAGISGSLSVDELIKKSRFDDSTNGSSREYLFGSTGDLSGASEPSSGSIEKFKARGSSLVS